MADNEMDAEQTGEMDQDELDSNGEDESLQDATETPGVNGKSKFIATSKSRF
jgi:hypothetical protein